MKINGTPPSAFIFNGKPATKAIFNGKTVWSSGDTPTPPEPPQPTGKYIALITNSSDASIWFSKSGSPTTLNIQYSRDAVTWTDWEDPIGTVLHFGGTRGNLYLRGNNPDGLAQTASDYHSFYPTVKNSGETIEVTGDLYALLSYESDTYVVPPCAFLRLFYRAGDIISKIPEIPHALVISDGAFSRYYRGTACHEIITRTSWDVTSNSSFVYDISGTYGVIYKLPAATFSGTGIPSTWTIQDL